MVNALRDLNYKFTDPNAEFSPDYFFNQSKQLKALRKVDVSTKDGLEAYFKIDPNAPNYDDVHLKEMPQMIAGYEANQIGTFARKNVKGLVALLSEQEAFEVALSSPAFRVKGKPDEDAEKEKERKAKEDKYNATVSRVAYTQEVFQKTEKDPKAYMKEVLRDIKLDSFSYGFFMANAQKIIQADRRISQQRAVDAVRSFGAQKYVGQNFARALELEKPTEAQQKAEEKIGNLQQAFNSETDKDKKLKLREDIEASLKKFQEDFKDALTAQGSIKAMIGALQEGAYDTIEQKKAEEEAKKKAEEEAKKKGKK